MRRSEGPAEALAAADARAAELELRARMLPDVELRDARLDAQLEARGLLERLYELAQWEQAISVERRRRGGA